jgi:hypothetical protein
MTRMRSLLLPASLATLAFFASLSSSCSSNSGTSSGSTAEGAKPPLKPGLTIFLSSELKGTTEPCGCNSDPLGDLARTSQIVAEAKKQGPVIFLDGGSTLYTQVNVSDGILAQEQLKSTLIEKTFADYINVAALGLGPYDLGEGAAKVRPARHAVNLAPEAGVALEAPAIIDAGGMKVGVFGVVSPVAMKTVGLEAGEAAPAATKAIAELKGKGAQVIVALAHMTKDESRALAQAAPGIDFLLIGQNLPEPDQVRHEAMQVGDTWLFRPANRGQYLSRLRLTRRGEGPFADAVGEVRAAIEIDSLSVELQTLTSDLEKWEADPNGDKAFIANKKKEFKELSERKATLETSALQAPAKGNYFTLGQLKINKALDCQPEVVAAKQAYDKSAGEANVKAAKAEPPAAPKGAATYVGIEECEMCHKEAVEFWKKTKHAKAWHTIEMVNKQFNFDCISCHVTGFQKPGGSSIGFNEPLRDVQCEQCHGPGSLHVDAEGEEEKRKTIVSRPEESVCMECHTKEHSDTFDFEPYLRDVTGPGHAPALRASLGDGPTGLELRSAALKKAGAGIGNHCPK